MARHVDAWMDGVKLASLGPILIQGVTETSPDQEIVYGVRPVRAGQNVRNNRRKALRISLDLAIRELFDLQRRTAVLQAVAGWCKGGVLELSNHPDQQLHVICKSIPALGSVRDYTSEISIEFEANEIPYWEEKWPVYASGNGNSGSVNLFVPGTCDDVPIDIVCSPASTATALLVSVSCGGATRTINLSGISTASDICFSRDEHDRLQITSGTASLLRYRTEQSADDLTVPAGVVVCSWESSCSCSVDFHAKGRWL